MQIIIDLAVLESMLNKWINNDYETVINFKLEQLIKVLKHECYSKLPVQCTRLQNRGKALQDHVQIAFSIHDSYFMHN